MTPLNVTSDLLLNDNDVGLMIHNDGALGPITVRLPPPRTYTTFEFLQLCCYPIIIHTNGKGQFLTQPFASQLTLSDDDTAYGRSIVIREFDGMWRIVRTTFNDQQLLFEEIKSCLDTVTTN